MHLSDVLVIGPISPRGSRVLRVRIGALLIAGLLAIVAAAGGCAVLVLRPTGTNGRTGCHTYLLGTVRAPRGLSRATTEQSRWIQTQPVQPSTIGPPFAGANFGAAPASGQMALA